MSVLVVGLSHKSAPVALLERAAVTGDALGKLLHDVNLSQHTAGAFVVSTCNRVEVYADVAKFHSGVSAISELLARHAGIDLAQLTRHLYVHYDERAVQHLFAVASGLDSMVVGEGQILGQVRQALKFADDQGTLGRPLADLGRLALHTGKRAHSETGIDRAGASMVTVGIDLLAGRLGWQGPLRPDDQRAAPSRPVVPDTAAGAPATAAQAGQRDVAPGQNAAASTGPGAGTQGPVAERPGDTAGPANPSMSSRLAAAPAGPAQAAPAEPPQSALPGPLAGARVLVVGAGAMSALAAATAVRAGAARIVIANRTVSRAQRLAASVGGTTAAFSDLPRHIAAADLVISCTGASGLVITAEIVRAALDIRAAVAASAPDATGGGVAADNPAAPPLAHLPQGPVALIDLALPRDVDPDVAGLGGTLVIGLAEIGAAGQTGGHGTASHDQDVAAVRRIVAEEVAAHASAVHAARVTPTVVALRAKAAKVVDAELTRLASRLSGAGSRELDEIAQAMRRVVDKLLHGPTVRVKELAGSPGGDAYAAALRELFDLDPKAVEAVTRADADLCAELGEGVS
jgi:glutamyl-tRNA reductase